MNGATGVTVTTTAYTATCQVLLSMAGGGTLANIGTPFVDTAASSVGTSFVIKSTNALDLNNNVSWWIIEP
jgi:hypothetical protein